MNVVVVFVAWTFYIHKERTEQNRRVHFILGHSRFSSNLPQLKQVKQQSTYRQVEIILLKVNFAIVDCVISLFSNFNLVKRDRWMDRQTDSRREVLLYYLETKTCSIMMIILLNWSVIIHPAQC